jgi:hypothetical protein
MTLDSRDLHELNEIRMQVLTRACILVAKGVVNGHPLTMPAAKRKAALEIRDELKRAHKRSPKQRQRVDADIAGPAITSGEGLAGELATAKERLFQMLTRTFAAHDRNRALDRQMRRRAKAAAAAQQQQSPPVAPPPAEDRGIVARVRDAVVGSDDEATRHLDCGMVVVGSGHHSPQFIDDSEYPPRFVDVVTRNHRESVERNEQLWREREQRDREAKG